MKFATELVDDGFKICPVFGQFGRSWEVLSLLTTFETKHTDTYVYGCLKETISIDSSSSNIRVSAPNIRSFGGGPHKW